MKKLINTKVIAIAILALAFFQFGQTTSYLPNKSTKVSQVKLPKFKTTVEIGYFQLSYNGVAQEFHAYGDGAGNVSAVYYTANDTGADVGPVDSFSGTYITSPGWKIDVALVWNGDSYSTNGKYIFTYE